MKREGGCSSETLNLASKGATVQERILCILVDMTRVLERSAEIISLKTEIK